jgi:transposase-like protein
MANRIKGIKRRKFPALPIGGRIKPGKKEKVVCPSCSSKNISRKGKRKTSFGLVQKYKCKSCGKNFTFRGQGLSRVGIKKVYPTKVIMNAISLYNQGYSLEKVCRLINSRFKIKLKPATLHSWLQEFRECSYYRIRQKVNELYQPKEVIGKKLFEHQQPYKFQYHKAKLKFFLNRYFSGLHEYIENIAEKCPDKLFKDSDLLRGSDLKLNVPANAIFVKEKYNYACRLAKLALEIASSNYERHAAIQDFMLNNDTCTIAAELPVYLFPEEIQDYKIFENLNLTEAITGHIDIVQARFGNIYLLDYKPEATKENVAEVVSQLFVYAFALSKRTGIWLRNIRCAWFDDKSYYEFCPGEIVLATQSMAEDEKIKYLPRYKKDSFFTGKGFNMLHKMRLSHLEQDEKKEVLNELAEKLEIDKN